MCEEPVDYHTQERNVSSARQKGDLDGAYEPGRSTGQEFEPVIRAEIPQAPPHVRVSYMYRYYGETSPTRR